MISLSDVLVRLHTIRNKANELPNGNQLVYDLDQLIDDVEDTLAELTRRVQHPSQMTGRRIP